MKRPGVICSAALLFCLPALAGDVQAVRKVVPAIKVTMPAAGASLIQGKDAGITWTYKGISDAALVMVDLYRSGAKLGDIALNVPVRYSQSPAGNGAYKWRVGDYFGGKAEPACNYSIRVQVLGGGGEKSDSGAFCIADSGLAPSLLLLAPRGGQNWTLGSVQQISWSCAQYSGPLVIHLFKGSQPWGVIARPDAKAGSYSWKVGEMPPPDNTHAWVTASDYRITIASQNNALKDEGAQAFTITGKPKVVSIGDPPPPRSLNVTSPVVGALWLRTKTYDIRWQQSDSLYKEFARIVLLKGGTKVLDISVHRPLQQGVHPWQVPDLNTLATGSDYQVQIQSLKYPEVYANSAMFRIDASSHDSTDIFSGKMTNIYRLDKKSNLDPDPVGEAPDYGPDTIRVGYRNWYERNQRPTGHRYRSRILFDLQGLKGQVKSASLSYQKSDQTPVAATELYIFDAPWNGIIAGFWHFIGTKLNLQDTGQMCTMVQKWVDNPAANYGLLIYMPEEVQKAFDGSGSCCENNNAHIQYFNNVQLKVVTAVPD